MSFLETLASVESYVGKLPQAEVDKMYWWIDGFSIDQHECQYAPPSVDDCWPDGSILSRSACILRLRERMMKRSTTATSTSTGDKQSAPLFGPATVKIKTQNRNPNTAPAGRRHPGGMEDARREHSRCFLLSDILMRLF